MRIEATLALTSSASRTRAALCPLARNDVWSGIFGRESHSSTT